MIRMRLAAIVADRLPLALTAAGCTAQPSAKAADPVVLTIGTDDKPGVPSAAEIEEFARQVTKLSDGAITIEPQWHAAGDVEDWDQAVAGMVVDGDCGSRAGAGTHLGRARCVDTRRADDALPHPERRTGA